MISVRWSGILYSKTRRKESPGQPKKMRPRLTAKGPVCATASSVAYKHSVELISESVSASLNQPSIGTIYSSFRLASREFWLDNHRIRF